LRIARYSSEALLRKGSARCGLQITLKRKCLLFVGKVHVRLERPWSVFFSVRHIFGIVFLETGTKIARNADRCCSGFEADKHISRKLLPLAEP
jgi:hypothetical protein